MINDTQEQIHYLIEKFKFEVVLQTGERVQDTVLESVEHKKRARIVQIVGEERLLLLFAWRFVGVGGVQEL